MSIIKILPFNIAMNESIGHLLSIATTIRRQPPFPPCTRLRHYREVENHNVDGNLLKKYFEKSSRQENQVSEMTVQDVQY